MTDWTFEFEIPFGTLGALLMALGLMAIAAWDLRALARSSLNARRRIVLGAARLASAAMAWLVAVQPSWSGERLERRNGRLAILFDASRSGLVRDGGSSRVERERDLAERWASELESPDRERPNVDVFSFGRALTPRTLTTLPRELVASEDDTRIGRALSELARRVGATEVGAAIVVSDGADLGSGSIAVAQRLGLRVHTIALGRSDALRDDSIAEVRADRVGFLRRPGVVRVRIRRLGAEPAPVPVVLSEGGQTLYETSAVLGPDGEGEVEIPFTPDRLGRIVYQLRIPTAQDDAVPENNERAFLVRTTRDNLRVLLVAGQPSWDERYLRAFLTRDPTTDLISFFILRNTADMTMAQPEELALIPFPTDELFQEHLGSFDVVLFQNFEYAPYQMAMYLPRIREYVSRGGSFAMIGGPLSFSHAGYAETPIADILPVGVLPHSTAETNAIATDRFHPVISDGASRHPILMLLPDERANADAWARLATLGGLNLVEDVRASAQRLLEHPTLRDATGAPMPVLVTGSAGRGRVLALMTDTSWRWGISTGGATGDPSAYERFWDRALRWLARDPALEPARVDTDHESYGPGSPLQARATIADARYAPRELSPVALVLFGNADRELSRVIVRTDTEGRLDSRLMAPGEPGGYRLAVLDPQSDEVLAQEWFIVEAGGQELADPRPNHALLESLAANTGGTSYASVDDAPRLSEIDASHVRSLGITKRRPFASVWAFLALVAFFGAEWVSRRRWGTR